LVTERVVSPKVGNHDEWRPGVLEHVPADRVLVRAVGGEDGGVLGAEIEHGIAVEVGVVELMSLMAPRGWRGSWPSPTTRCH
jgi:hypothetical protein